MPPDTDDKHRTGWRKWCRCPYRALKALFPPRDEGSVRLQGLRTKYRVERTTAATANEESPQKTRVVWDAAEQHLERLGPRAVEDAEEGRHSPMVSDASWRSSPPTLLTRTCSRRRPQSDAAEDKKVAANAPLRTAYCDGATVEYFSMRNQQWVVGRVHVALCGGGARYDVHLPRSGQRRLGVALDLLRPPLRAGEPVECGPLTPMVNGLIAVGEEPEWQRGAVTKPEVSRAAVTDYVVLLEGARGSATAPSHQVRRYFQPGSRVEIYRGIELGWLRAEVAHGVFFQEYNRAESVTATATLATSPASASSQRARLQPGSPAPPSRLQLPAEVGRRSTTGSGAAFPASDLVGQRFSQGAAARLHLPAEVDRRASTGGGAAWHASELVGQRLSQGSAAPDAVQSVPSNASVCDASAEAPPWALLPICATGLDGGGDGGGSVEWIPAFLVRMAQ